MKITIYTKSLFFMLTGFSLFFSSVINAQQVPNGGFEDWTQTSFFKTPSGYYSSNFQSYLSMGIPNVTKTTEAHSGSFAARLETVVADADLIPGCLFIGQPGNPGLSPGIPYTQRPDSIRFFAKYNINTGDNALVALLFKAQGIPIGYAMVSLQGNENDYIAITSEVIWDDPELIPDSVVLNVNSSNPDLGFSPGSVLYLDDITMIGATEQLPNNGFEDWIDISAEVPNNWYTSNPYTLESSGTSVNKSTDHFDGLFSVQITNAIGGFGDTISYVANGNLSGNGTGGGAPVTQNPVSINFYYKYQPVGSDSAMAYAMISRWDSQFNSRIQLDFATIKLGAHSEWTYDELPFTYAGFPNADTITVFFAPSQIDGSGSAIQLGSSLWVDNVQIEYGAVGIHDAIVQQPIGIYPNPVNNSFNIQGDSSVNILIEILSLDGKLLKSMQIVPGAKTDISELQAGCYLYRMIIGYSVITGKFVKI